MKILFIVPYYKPAYIYGGPIVVIARLAETLVAMGHKVTVYTSTANGENELSVIPGEATLVDGVTVHYFTRVTGDNTNASPALWQYLNRTAKSFDVVHIHSWWNFLVLGAAWVCKRHNIKPIISPHGMLSDYILTANNALKKQVIHKTIGKRLLTNSIVHVSTPMEWEESKKIVPSWQGRIIANLVNLPTTPHERGENDIFTIGFLSRVDPKKGLDILLNALKNVSAPCRLLIAGAGSEEYTEELKRLAIAIGVADKVEWVGWKNGEAKFQFFANLDLFALTSHSENFAIVVIEALATGTPVLISKNVGLFQYVKNQDYGWVTNLDPNEVSATIEAAIQDKQKRQQITTAAPITIRAEYDDKRLAQQYLDLYTDSISR